MVFVMISTRRLLYFLFFLMAGTLILIAAPRIWAEDQIKVTVVAVLATTQNKNVDPKLECLAKEVQKTHPELTGFRIERCSCQELSVGDKAKFPLVEDEFAEVSIQRGPGKNDRVGMTVKPPKAGEFVYACCCGKFLPICTRYWTKEKEQLIVAVRVQCCNKEKKPESK
jgi:hypothetical protein